MNFLNLIKIGFILKMSLLQSPGKIKHNAFAKMCPHVKLMDYFARNNEGPWTYEIKRYLYIYERADNINSRLQANNEIKEQIGKVFL